MLSQEKLIYIGTKKRKIHGDYVRRNENQMNINTKGILGKIVGIPLNFIFKKYLPQILLNQYLIQGDKSKVKIAPTAYMLNTLFNVASGTITIEDYVFCGHNVCIITGAHDYKKKGIERQRSFPKSGRDVIVKQGVWIGSNVTILGPCVIGENSVIGAGCLIRKDVPPNTICLSSNSTLMKEIKYPNRNSDSQKVCAF
jgi:acetyltransferase-like isoleucine patch superfamily enzyme